MKRRALVSLLGVVAALSACVPGPVTPPGADWVATRIARTATTTSTANHVGALATNDWFVTAEVFTPALGSSTATLKFFPRSGPGNSILGSPQLLTPSVPIGFAGPLGEHIVAVGAGPAVEFFRETNATWGSAGTFTIAAGSQLITVSDRWMVARLLPTSPGTEGTVTVYSLDTSGPTVVPTLAATLGPDPAWPLSLREGFGTPSIALDGDLLMVGAQGQFNPTPGGARLFRATGGVWSAVQSVGAEPGGPNSFARAMAVDDGPTLDRYAVSPPGPSTAPTPVDIYADSGSGFVLEQSVNRDASEPDSTDGLLFGSTLALDDDLLAVAGRGSLLASSEPGHPDVAVGSVQLFRRSGGAWSREAEVNTFPVPPPTGVRNMNPFRLQVSGDHVAVTVFITPDPPPGCVFPCFVFGFEAWSLDRTN